MKGIRKTFIIIFCAMVCILVLINFAFADIFVYMNINKIDAENGAVHYEIHNYSLRRLTSHLNPVGVLYKQNIDGNWDVVYRAELIEDATISTKPLSVCSCIVEANDRLEPGLYKIVTDDFSFGNYESIFYKELHMEMQFNVY